MPRVVPAADTFTKTRPRACLCRHAMARAFLPLLCSMREAWQRKEMLLSIPHAHAYCPLIICARQVHHEARCQAYAAGVRQEWSTREAVAECACAADLF